MAARDGTVERLADRPDYRATGGRGAAGSAGRHAGDVVLQSIGGIAAAVVRPAHVRKRRKEYLAEHAEGNPFFAALLDSMAANELPPFEVIARYMTPSVGILYDTDTGFHGIAFTIRNEEEAAP